MSSSKGRQRPLKHLQICPVCGAYMRPATSASGSPHLPRSVELTHTPTFGGVEMRTYICEKCHHRERFQVDMAAHIREDDSTNE